VFPLRTFHAAQFWQHGCVPSRAGAPQENLSEAKEFLERVRQRPDNQERNYDHRHDMQGFDGAVRCASRAAGVPLLVSDPERAAALGEVRPEAGGYADALSEAEIHRFWETSSVIS
jgi:hypothetical protein